ncbi:MAG: hypothetical protein Q9225_000163 [Loekoesia sp. 1 TL-2023]
MSDGSESQDVEHFLVSNEKAEKSGHTTRFEREEELRNLWNDDDDGKPAETTDAEVQEHSATETPTKQMEEEPAASIAATGGRRRGRRKVMKKKTLKDDEGYLGLCFSQLQDKGVIRRMTDLMRTTVTKEEPAWESFSEDEPPPKEATPVSTASSTAKVKKAAGKPGQGNIMSFFGKK